jgi:hypothetical protein
VSLSLGTPDPDPGTKKGSVYISNVTVVDSDPRDLNSKLLQYYRWQSLRFACWNGSTSTLQNQGQLGTAFVEVWNMRYGG